MTTTHLKPYYQSQRVTLYCGDALDVMPIVPSGSVRMIWTDPPYGHGNQDGDLQAARVRDGVAGARKRSAEPIANDSGPDFDALMRGFMDEAARILSPDCCCCCCCCMGGGGPTVTFARMSMEIDQRLAFFQAIVWDKTARGPGMGWRFRRDYEFVIVSHRKGGRLAWNEDHPAISNIVRDMPVNQRQHPNEKPVSLVRRFIEAHTLPDDLICDPFGGSGTTAVAAIQTGRRAIVVELEECYCEIAARRIQEAEQAFALFEPQKPEQQGEIFA